MSPEHVRTIVLLGCWPRLQSKWSMKQCVVMMTLNRRDKGFYVMRLCCTAAEASGLGPPTWRCLMLSQLPVWRWDRL
jgi:hypothetical protein